MGLELGPQLKWRWNCNTQPIWSQLTTRVYPNSNLLDHDIFIFTTFNDKKKKNVSRFVPNLVFKFKIAVSASSRRPIRSFFSLNKFLNLRTDSFSRLRQKCQDRLLRCGPRPGFGVWCKSDLFRARPNLSECFATDRSLDQQTALIIK